MCVHVPVPGQCGAPSRAAGGGHPGAAGTRSWRAQRWDRLVLVGSLPTIETLKWTGSRHNPQEPCKAWCVSREERTVRSRRSALTVSEPASTGRSGPPSRP